MCVLFVYMCQFTRKCHSCHVVVDLYSHMCVQMCVPESRCSMPASVHLRVLVYLHCVCIFSMYIQSAPTKG